MMQIMEYFIKEVINPFFKIYDKKVSLPQGINNLLLLLNVLHLAK
jgi:hypothetical protein